MSQHQAGYATVAVTGLLAGLSVLGVSYLNLSNASLNISDRATRQLLLDGRLEEVLAETITHLANGIHETTDYPRQHRIGQSSVSISVENERNKLNLHRATEKELSEVLAQIDLNRDQEIDIRRNFREKRMKSSEKMSFSDVLPADFDAEAFSCLQSVVTEFTPPIVFKRASAAEVLDGEILRVRVDAEAKGQSSRGLEAFVLFTGDRADPVWVMKWNRYFLTSDWGCKI